LQQLVSEQGQCEDVYNQFNIQQFNDVINFNMWQIRMNAILTQIRLKKALPGKNKKSENMKEETGQKMDEKGLAVIQIFLADEVFDEFSSK